MLEQSNIVIDRHDTVRVELIAHLIARLIEHLAKHSDAILLLSMIEQSALFYTV